MKDLIAAIDLGTTKVVVAVGEKTELGVKVVAYGETPSKGIKRGRIENVRFAHQALQEALKKVENQLNMKITKAFVGIAGQDIKCISPEPFQIQRKNFESLISEEEIMDITNGTYNMIPEDGYKVFYSVPQSYNVDNYMSVSEPVGMLGRNIVARFKLFASKENSLRMIKSTLAMSNIEPIEIVLEPVSSARAVLTDDEMEVGSVLVDIGGGTTDVIVYHHNIIRYAGIIPFGGNSVTEDICTGCGISAKNAEIIKKSYGCSFSDYADPSLKIVIPGIGAGSNKEIQAKTLSRIIQARMEEILEAVCWHVEQSGFKDTIRSGMVLTGGGAKLNNLSNLADFVTGFETRIGEPNTMELDPGSCDGIMDTTAATAVGMLIYAFKKMEYENLVITDCVKDIREPEKTEEIEETVVIKTGNNSSNGGSESKKESKKGRGWLSGIGKGLKKVTKEVLDGESLFSSDSNEV